MRATTGARGLIAVAATAALASAGCGSSGPSGISPSSYVHAVCTTLATWRTGVQDASNQLQTSATGSTSLAQFKQQYQTFVSALLADTDRAKTELNVAGVPAVKNGKQISSTLVQAFTNASMGLSQAQSQASQVPTRDPATFKTATTAVTATISGALANMKNVSPKKDPQLHAAANKDPACKALKTS